MSLLACRRGLLPLLGPGACPSVLGSLLFELHAADGWHVAEACDGKACFSALAEPGSRQQPQQQHDRGGWRKTERGRSSADTAAVATRTDAERSWQNSLAMQNAPRKVFELIGDPRSGLADNVSSNAFGEITVDMVHHQMSNEVYWYKYEFSGNTMQETHRDARLSEHTKNLIYILRAKDPARWTIEALAAKFHVRRQRILAILALKEMEAHRMEAGTSLPGPLSAYACPVDLADVQLDVRTGEPVYLKLSGRAAEAAAAEAAATHPQKVGQELPLLKKVAQEVQLQLLQALQPFGYSLDAIKQELVQQVSQIERQLQQHLPPAGGSSGSGEAAAAAEPDPAAKAFSEVKRQLEELVAAAQKLLSISDVLREEQELEEASKKLQAALKQQEQQGKESAKEAAGEPPAEDAAASAPADAAAAAVVEGWEGSRLLRLVLTLPLPQRKQLLEAAQQVSIDLTSHGVDLGSLTSSASYQGPYVAATPAQADAPGSKAAAQQVPLPADVDVLGYQPVEEAVLEEIVAAMAGLETSLKSLAALSGKASGRAALGTSSVGAKELRELLRLRRTYLSAEAMVASLQEQQLSEAEGAPRRAGEEEKRHMMKLLYEMDPSYPERAVKYDEVMGLLAQGATDVALLGLQELEGSEERAKAVLAAMSGESGAPNQYIDPAQPLKLGESVAPRASDRLRKESWDLVAAHLDARVANKVYHRGSGERHLVRLPSYPAFEGYTLQEFDRAQEGELSQLNREVAKREEEELLARFRSSLLFNLGLVGPDLWDTSRPAPEPNVASSLDKPLVVYDISKSGETLYPPLKVVDTDGKERPLNEQERVYQERRRPQRSIAYQLQRVRRKPELD